MGERRGSGSGDSTEGQRTGSKVGEKRGAHSVFLHTLVSEILFIMSFTIKHGS